MSQKLLCITAFLAAFSMNASHAQDTKNDSESTSVSQSDDSTASPPDSSAYGGAGGKSASGSIGKTGGTQQAVCVGPASFCDIYKGS